MLTDDTIRSQLASLADRAAVREGTGRMAAERAVRRRRRRVGAAVAVALGAGAAAGLVFAQPDRHKTAVVRVAVVPTPSASSVPTPADVCGLPQLSYEGVLYGAWSGNDDATLGFTNSGNSSCTVTGFAGLQLIDSQGTPAMTSVHQGADEFTEPQDPTPVLLVPGQQTSFDVIFRADNNDGTGCDAVPSLRVTLPENGGSVTLPVGTNACDGALQETPFHAGFQKPH